jgi:hypothetical protein
MSARKIGSVGPLQQQVAIATRQTRLELSPDSVAIHKNGIEFRSPSAFKEWAEMTVTLSSPGGGTLQCTGVVIACSGNKHIGYRVSLVFTNISKQAQVRLNTMAGLQPGL